MSRLANKSDSARSGRFYSHQLPFHKGSSTPPKFTSSTSAIQPFNHNSHNKAYSHFKHQFSGRTTSANLTSLNQLSDQSSEEEELEQEEEELDELERRSINHIKLGIPTRSMQPPTSTPSRNNLNNKSLGGNSGGSGSGGRRKSNGGAGGKKNGKNGERKASVRKQDYELEAVLGLLEEDHDDDESDLTDVPSVEGKGGGEEEKGGENSEGDQHSDSDPEMEAKLRAAGDGESLLGSANSDQDEEEEIEEEQYIIEDTLLREAKARARAQQAGRTFSGIGGTSSSSRGRGSGHGRGARNGSSSQRKSNAMDEDGDQDADEEDGNDQEADDEMDGGDLAAPSWSPQTMKLLGLPVVDQDELFEEQDGFHSSSEPSFTDFFGSSDDGEDSNAREDDDESTDDDLGGSEDEISDLDGGILGAPFLAHFTTTQDGGDLLNGLAGGAGGDLIASSGAAGNVNGSSSSLTNNTQAEVPLLVIEDLDGRLIYARAGDGEAVFGSDGEFEFVDDSDEDDTDDELTFNGLSRGRSSRRGVLDEDTWRELGLDPSDIGDESGETTDELPDEDMPFPRLLVGSVAPHGGRAARRARAMAAKSRMLSPSGGNTPRGRQRSRQHSSSIGSLSNQNDAAPRAASLERLNSSDSIEVDQNIGETKDQDQSQKVGESSSQNVESTEPTTPETKEKELPSTSTKSDFPKPEMGSFMPASAKSVHRAVIDGSHKAPSPFASRLALQSRGLSRKRNQRRDSSSTQSSKRPRRFSLDGTSSANHGTGTASEAPSSPERALHSASEAPAEIDAMDLDDVVEASMLWRGDRSKSPSADEDVADRTEPEEDSDLGSLIQIGSPALRAKAAKEARRLAKGKGKDVDVKGKGKSKSSSFSSSSNAFARWDKIPLGAFRDTQSSRGGSSSRNHESQSGSNRGPGQNYSHRLGTFLLTAAGSRSGNHHSVESSFSANRRNSRHNQESSPFRGRREARSAEQALSFAMGGNTLLDLERARAAASANGHSGRDATFIVSPVLFPVRHRRSSQVGGLGPQDPDDDVSSVRLPEALSPSGQSSIQGASDVDMNVGRSSRRPDLPPGRITKREKREKRARRAAAQLQMQIALAAQAEMAQQQIQNRSAGNGTDTATTTPPLNEENEKKEELMGSANSILSQTNDDSPAASLAMPRLSITDASPRNSPGAQGPVAPLPKRFQREGSASLMKGSNESTSTSNNQLVSGPLSPNSSSMPPPSSTSSSTNPPNLNNSSQEYGESSQSSQIQTSPVLRPPSSSFGGPLHSPLFGGIGMYGPQGAEEGDGEGEHVAALSI